MIVKVAQLGRPIREVPVTYRRRRGGRSKVSGTWRGTVGAAYRMCRVAYKYARQARDR
jgi:hypothetical protein